MADSQSVVLPGPTLKIECTQPEPVRMHYIFEPELLAIRDADSRESTLLAFFCLCAGSLVTIVLTWLTLDMSKIGAVAVGAYVGTTVALIVLSVLLGTMWWRTRKTRTQTLDSIQKRVLQPSKDA